jgi:iron complex outermembrane receptor protein
VLGNPNLKPATSKNISLGFIWNLTQEVNLIIDYWSINHKDRIEAESAQVLLNTNPFATSVTRNQFGELIAVSTSYFNEEKTEINGIDAEINFFKATKYGDFNYSMKATQLSEFLTPEYSEEEMSPIMINRVGKFNYDAHTHSLPKLRLNTFLSWTLNDLILGMNTRYVDGYSNERQIPVTAINLGYTNYVKSFLVYDFSVKKTVQLSLGEMEIGIGIINAFDKKAPLLYDAPDFSFDTKVHDPRGRLINLTAEFNL